jgi:hypothetical protein
MNISTVSTGELVRLARESLEAGMETAEIFGELGRRYNYSAAPKEDRAMILDFDRSFVIPRLGYTKLPPGIIQVPGARRPSIPEYYKVNSQPSTSASVKIAAAPAKEAAKK